ncbi:hypothetical protein TrLO_g7531 [Triparma laevis f. longispina]|uniref:Uncharacterized protein n=1 Tax=Triparma laevis f. longispina TaxID=1714387 RepID=A0A9W7F8M7_9STRA|nr:hypothetical protein TrLO_g7531 [Triparma laevis f. longispina]
MNPDILPDPSPMVSAEEDNLLSSDDETPASTAPDPLYSQYLDEEDSAWVYQNLRSGHPENIPTNAIPSSPSKSNQLLTPRSSSGSLTCPCCFTLLTMDSQRHEKWGTQFRSILVMNVFVDFSVPLSHTSKGFLKIEGEVNAMEPPKKLNEIECWYKTQCARCGTGVAWLEYGEEVYHFYDCLESS